MRDTVHDVVIVGAGPVGLALGRMLGLRGHEVLLLERWPEAYPLPRAVHFDDEIGRIFQNMGLAEEIRAVSQPVPDHYEWRNAAGQALVRIDWSGTGPSGWPTANFFCQPELENVLSDAVEGMDNVTLLRGAEVVDVVDTGDVVEVSFTGALAKRQRVHGRFVVGCDGANSFVRERLGTTMPDHGFFYDWLIVDTIPLDEREWSPMNWQLCDPARPTTVVSGGPGRRRWEFMRRPEETREELDTEEKAWELLKAWDRTPDNTRLERHAVYTFAARWAERWNRGRLVIAGDAAHQMPPFAGQGMCSGLRDVANLSWKLDRVLRGRSGIGLLDTYTAERRVHVQHAIAMSIALGKVICVLDEDQAAARDARMIDGGADPARVLPVSEQPILGPGVTAEDIGVPALRGTLAPQYPVRRAARRGPLDELTGYGPLLLATGDRAAAELDPAAHQACEQARVPMLTVGTGTPDLVDESGEWSHWFGTHGIAAVLVRPDHYITGAVTEHGTIPALLARYRAAVDGGSPPANPTVDHRSPATSA
ncbi:bifunctional 3-(3-hydroxy-phenyl)propionate/3-hydroxycinnamic acid hydroxylase [Amycolatopsis endophytica]|uniref:2-polyprenyl-6-methoxyphenol hydroxylase-like FAD-dependent oxidoreductase n=1 Tax=Amycolatopsis endophytica TaxID=860233 RepID=A0A853BC36_9PSEU|nr:bifunctional 3-(3-hydroxy-phenyl)propionate/3-hydroxycinnamic acid hydroxylase [Amycolatopsis endophytica]NYI92345.1 2-polyprenyl-6-methoxyphenol hydroxylase-like FAD-dependent oxidoreductase [Amycolatopsis endophytica]